MNQIVKPYFSACGDHMQFSTLPQRYAELGQDAYLSQSAQGSEQVVDLVWRKNPYILGVLPGTPTLGDATPGYVYRNECDWFIENVELSNGLEPKNKFPIIYYQPQIHAVQDYGLINISSKSLASQYDITESIEQVRRIMSLYDIPFFQISGKYVQNNIVIPEARQLEERDIYHQVDLIYNCRVFVSMSSGPQMLACGIRHIWEGDQWCLIPNQSWDTLMGRKLFIMPQVNYIKI